MRVHLKAPGWWDQKTGVIPFLLAPVGYLIGGIMAAQWKFRRPLHASLPVICIGNLNAGGAGKTPTAIAVAALLEELGAQPAFLSRGYGGTMRGPHLVDKMRDSAREVGDEPMLLARHAAAVIAADRPEGAALAAAQGVNVVVMDDGFQNPSLFKDLSLIVIDAQAGIGNGMVLPAGPLRAPLGFQLARADALIVVGDGEAANDIAEWMDAHGRPVFRAKLVPDEKTDWIAHASLIACAGIGRPEKFFDTVEALGCNLIATVPFADHHRYSETDAERLLASAKRTKAQLVTTEKDLVRIPDTEGPLGELKAAARALPVRLRFADSAKVQALLKPLLTRRAKA